MTEFTVTLTSKPVAYRANDDGSIEVDIELFASDIPIGTYTIRDIDVSQVTES